MLFISDTQLEQIRHATRINFIDRIRSYLGRNFPEEFQNLGEAESKALVEIAVSQCLKHEISTIKEITRYAAFLIVCRHMKLNSEALNGYRILSRTDLPAWHRMNLIVKLLSTEVYR